MALPVQARSIAMQTAVACLIVLASCGASLLVEGKKTTFRDWCKAPPSSQASSSTATSLQSQLQCDTPSSSSSASSWMLPEAHLEAGTAQLGAQSRLRAAMHRFLEQNKSLTIGFVGQGEEGS